MLGELTLAQRVPIRSLDLPISQEFDGVTLDYKINRLKSVFFARLSTSPRT